MPPVFDGKDLALMLLGLPDTAKSRVMIAKIMHTQNGIESNKTAKNIHSNITLIMRGLGTSNVLDLYTADKDGAYPASAWIEDRDIAPASKARYYSSLLSVANPDRAAARIAKHVEQHARDHFRQMMRSHDKTVRDDMDENLADEQELSTILPWTDIVDAYNKNRGGLSDQHALIADMYIGYASDPAAAPRRLDYNALRVYASRPASPEANYVVVNAAKSCVSLHLSEFKTAAKRQEPIEAELPKGLARCIIDSLGGKPWRKYLLYKSRGAERCTPLSAHLLGYHVKETTRELTGKCIPVNGLRKSFITWLHSQNVSVARLKEFAYQMGHSVEMAALYRRINIEDSRTSGGGERCFLCGLGGHRAKECTSREKT